VRTLRRIKNQQGYRPRESTFARIKPDVTRIDRRVQKMVVSGEAFVSRTVTTRGKRRRIIEQVKGQEYKLPPMPVLQTPMIFPSKGGGSRTFMLNVANWTTEEKTDYMRVMHAEKRFTSWHARVDLREYIIRKLETEYGDLADVPPEELADATANHFVVIGPYEFGRTLSDLRSAINIVKRYDDAGRKIVELYFVENLKPKSKRKGR
jgi:hypothetical protein